MRVVLQRRIASGGLGEVYVGQVVGDQRLVAVKRLHPRLAMDREIVEAFERERDMLVRLSHPHLVRGFGAVDIVGESGPGFGLELIDGPSLAALLAAMVKRRQQLAVNVVLRIVRDVVDALGCLHEAGFAHLDICPANILVSTRGVTWLCDLGHIRAIGAHMRSVSRPAYASPELLERGEVSASADLFSIGVVLWEALRLERLFAAESDLATMLRAAETAAPRLEQGRPDLAEFPVLSAIVANLLDRDPSKRARSCSEVLAMIDESGLVAVDDDIAATLSSLRGAPTRQR